MTKGKKSHVIDPSDFAARVEAFPGTEVLCVGDVMLDRFVYGEVERVSPEAPVPVLHIQREETVLGGAGNVLRNLLAYGAKARFFTLVGDDPAGNEIRDLIRKEGAGNDDVLVERGRQTTIKNRFIAGSQQLLRADQESPVMPSEAAREKLLSGIEEALPSASVLLLSDYGKGVLAGDTAERILALAKKAKVPALVDPKGFDYSRYRGATLLSPNLRELHEATLLPVATDEDVVVAAGKLLEGVGVEGVLVTRSARGMTLVTKGKEALHLSARAREVFDVSGAGDTVLATLATALAAGASLSDAAYLANVAAGIVVGKVGTAVVHPEDLVTALHERDLLASADRIVSLEQASETIARWRRQGFRIGFTNGCFDLLHPGHISLLRQAKGACDRLIVGLNSDASVTRLKGPDRPVQSEMARATVLASVSDVDLVVVFTEDTPVRLLKAIRPDVLVKGADYRVDEVVGGDFVTSYGGKILLADFVDGHSTSATITRIAK
ncbi:MAG: D-glycero-beta-D-manno-heptose-7-phosphate kinase [Alphaproteobacteria bacterium]